ncbi:MAG: CDP-diacylglycerol--serine O-phosphatidyltransferase [Bacilli bacterium]|nr:CDP-diacylglycerol--serine O-phosphatidyltransferase [Bacilli bacterium]
MIGIYNYTVLFTLFGTISGVIGINEAANGNIETALFCLLVCGFFDMFDGMVARTKKNRSEFELQYGIQLDSLSDVICFGALPTTIALQITKPLGLWSALSILYLVATISRLAYFNVEEAMRRKEESGGRKTYTGLPVTPSALIYPALYLLSFPFKNAFPILFLIGILITACFHVSKLKLPHLHLKGLLICLIIGLIILISYLIFQNHLVF